MPTILTLVLALLLALLPAAPARASTCTMAAGDRQWIETSIGAWRYMTQRLRLPPEPEPTIVVFDRSCRFEGTSGQSSWRGERHSGSIRLPDGNRVPAEVTSFAGHNEKLAEPFFVMALPSVWRAANIPISEDSRGLVGVFLHEFSHTRQVRVLQPVFKAAEALYRMPDDFDDDSLQQHFQSDPIYVAAVEKERDLLYQAAAEADPAKAKALARQALAIMEARQKRWFVGQQSYWKNYDDLFLTMEGLGQWVAYAWLADPKGGGLSAAAARDRMRGSRRWWSQDEGLALLLVIDRFVPDWPKQAFASRPALGIDLLRQAVAEA